MVDERNFMNKQLGKHLMGREVSAPVEKELPEETAGLTCPHCGQSIEVSLGDGQNEQSETKIEEELEHS